MHGNKSRNIFLHISAFTCLSVLIVLCMLPTPQREEVTALQERAESIYQKGNFSQLDCLAYELVLRNQKGEILAYYDELQNYEQVVREIFTEKGIQELEQSYSGMTPLIFKKNGKVYRSSSTTESDSTTYFCNPSSIKMIGRGWNRFMYEAVLIPECRENQGNPVKIQFSLQRKKGRLLVEKLNYPGVFLYKGAYTDEQLQNFNISEL